MALALFFISFLSGRFQRAPWYEQWAWNVVSPAVKVFFSIKSAGRSLWGHYFYLVGVARENETLQQKLLYFLQRQVSFDELDRENKRLTALLELKQLRWPQGVAARVVAFDPQSEFKSIRIDKGAKDGIQFDMPVIAREGLVGKVGPVFKNDALVLLIVDPANFVDVVVERSGFRALLRGSGFLKQAELQHGIFLTILEYLKKQSDIQPKDLIITSGLDGLYPKGVVVGELEALEKDPYGLFLKGKVRPIVDFTLLKEVLVLKEEGSRSIVHGP